MKKKSMKILSAAFAAGTLLLWGCGGDQKTETTETMNGRLPQDVQATCTVSQEAFDSWFVGGKASENGTVMPANSVTFPHTNNCSFYTWSEQMFLWITSPTSGGKYTPGNTVLESPVFYDVTGENSSGQRFLVKHEPGVKTMKVSSHISQNGPNKLPMIMDNQGRLFEVEGRDEPATKRPILKNARNQVKEVNSVEEGADGRHIFKDIAGKVIDAPKPVIVHTQNQERIVREFKVGEKSIYLDRDGNEILTEVGQATGDVLMAQNGSIVYYLLMVNDVYAYYLTATKNSQMSGYQFPTTAAARDSICAIARQNGETLPDSNALAIELKTAWVEAVNLPDPGSYITVDAEVPVYDTTNPKKWIPKGAETRKTKLALIGMHVVGSLAGHPEMSWATFEHNNNAPNAAYQYINTKGDTVTVPQDTGKGYLLCGNTAGATFNQSHMKSSGDTINGYKGNNVSMSNTILTFPFGTEMNTVGNPENKSSAASNSEIIGINNNIMKMLVGKDMRKNYLLIGATWTSGGAAPDGKSYTDTTTTPGVAIGSSMLANSTMETYFQRPGKSCFTCHNGPNTLLPGDLSHIFDNLQPLPSLPKTMK